MALFKFKKSLDFQTEVSKQAMEACEHIITEMGAELHDDLIQKLSALRLHMDKIERSSFSPEETQQAIVRMQADFQNIVDSVRRISRRLHPVRMEDDTFHKRIEMLCQNMDTPGAIRIHPLFTGEEKSLTPLVESYLLRMIQELVHNALRHSAAWHVWVRLDWSPYELVIEVEDDGSGFAKVKDFVGKLRQKHNTLRMRCEAIGGTVQYRASEKGLLATVRLPLGKTRS
jgi:signal transduction histidine kinase